MDANIRYVITAQKALKCWYKEQKYPAQNVSMPKWKLIRLQWMMLDKHFHSDFHFVSFNFRHFPDQKKCIFRIVEAFHWNISCRSVSVYFNQKATRCNVSRALPSSDLDICLLFSESRRKQFLQQTKRTKHFSVSLFPTRIAEKWKCMR